MLVWVIVQPATDRRLFDRAYAELRRSRKQYLYRTARRNFSERLLLALLWLGSAFPGFHGPADGLYRHVEGQGDTWHRESGGKVCARHRFGSVRKAAAVLGQRQSHRSTLSSHGFDQLLRLLQLLMLCDKVLVTRQYLVARLGKPRVRSNKHTR